MVTSLRISMVFLAAVLVAGACGAGAATTAPTATPSPTPVPTHHSGFASTMPMSMHRAGHSATLLANGRVLIAGGRGGSGPVASAELFDPRTDSFTLTGSMAAARVSDLQARYTVPPGIILCVSTCPRPEGW